MVRLGPAKLIGRIQKITACLMIEPEDSVIQDRRQYRRRNMVTDELFSMESIPGAMM